MDSVKIDSILYTINKRNKTTNIKLILSSSAKIKIKKEYFKVNLRTNPEINNITDVKLKNNVIFIYTDIKYQKINNFEQILFSYIENNENKLFDIEYNNFPISNKNISPYINIINMSKLFKIDNIITLNNIKQKIFNKCYFQSNICNPSLFFNKSELYINDAIAYKFNFHCIEMMQLKLHIAFTGMINIWQNNNEIYSGKNENKLVFFYDEGIPIIGNIGENEIVILYNYKNIKEKTTKTNIGIAIRIERTGYVNGNNILPRLIRGKDNRVV